MSMNERVRKGKIARLACDIRDELNRRLQDGEQGKDLVAWLNSLPKVRAVLKAHFGGRGINTPNLTAWVQSGYREWQLQQETVEIVQRMNAESGGSNKSHKTPLIDLMTQRLAARYVIATRTANQPDGEDENDVKFLHGFCKDVVMLRRSSHSAERLELERERLELEEERFRKVRDEGFLELAWSRREEVLSYIGRRLKANET